MHTIRPITLFLLGLLFGLGILGAAGITRAQTTAAPSSHWGALMYPELEPSAQVGFELLGFTEFGKNVGPDGKPLPRGVAGGERDFYNDEGRTIGINLLSWSETRPLRRFNSQASNLLYKSTFVVGWINDRMVRWFQNDVIHQAADLQDIPRDRRLCTPMKWSKLKCYALGYSGELNYRIHSLSRNSAGYVFRASPLYVGAGFNLSTIENEGFVHSGVRDFRLIQPSWFPVALGVSGTIRAGVTAPGLTFRRLAGHYVTAQSSLALHIAEYYFPVTFEFGFTGTTGQFIDRRRAKDDESQQPPAPLRERFWVFRLSIAEFVFETFNDQLGGKDKGPSYGARVFWTLTPGAGSSGYAF